MFNCTPGLVISPLYRRVSTSGPLYCGYSTKSYKNMILEVVFAELGAMIMVIFITCSDHISSIPPSCLAVWWGILQSFTMFYIYMFAAVVFYKTENQPCHILSFFYIFLTMQNFCSSKILI